MRLEINTKGVNLTNLQDGDGDGVSAFCIGKEAEGSSHTTGV